MTDFEERIERALDAALADLGGITSSAFLLEAVYKMAMSTFSEGLAQRCGIDGFDAAEFLRGLASKTEAAGEKQELEDVIYANLKPAAASN